MAISFYQVAIGDTAVLFFFLLLSWLFLFKISKMIESTVGGVGDHHGSKSLLTAVLFFFSFVFCDRVTERQIVEYQGQCKSLLLPLIGPEASKTRERA